jgi:hypothetical protein
MRVLDALNASLLTPGKFFVVQSVTENTTPLKHRFSAKTRKPRVGRPGGAIACPPSGRISLGTQRGYHKLMLTPKDRHLRRIYEHRQRI